MDDPLQMTPRGWDPPSGTRRRQEGKEERRKVHLGGRDIIQTWVYAPYLDVRKWQRVHQDNG